MPKHSSAKESAELNTQYPPEKDVRTRSIKQIGKNRKKGYLAGIILILALALVSITYFHTKPKLYTSNSNMQTHKIDKSATTSIHSDRIRLLAAGDFIAHDSINANAKQSDGSFNYMPMMDSFKPVFAAADIRFCNDANLNGGPQFGISGYPKFNSPTEFVRDMGNLGCNMINSATNHSFDRNQDAINSSIDATNKIPGLLAAVGHNKNSADHDQVHYFSLKGVKFAFLAYTTYLNIDAPAQNDYGVNVYSDSFASQQIDEAKASGAQIIMVSIRWGTEYSAEVSQSQKQTAQFLGNKGVDIILGHGSHVLEPVQEVSGTSGNKTIVWYSLGNFLNTQIPPETLFNGLAVIDFSKSTRKITNMSFLPIYVHYEWSADQAKSQDLLARSNIKIYPLDSATQTQIDAQQLSTTAEQQRSRLNTTLNTYMSIPLINLSDYYK